MKYLTLLRHAKSSWSDPDLDDFDRPLNDRGQRDAPMMGRRLAERGFQLPDLLLVSPARRARMTVEAVSDELGIEPERAVFDDRIYLATVEELVDLAREIPDDRHSVLLVGHNPGLTEFANHLVDGSLENLPTCAVFSVELQVSAWRDLDQGAGKLLFYDYPKRIPDELPAAKGEGEMSCLKGKSKAKPKPGAYTCEKCEAVSKKKDDLCKAKKIKEKDKKKK